MQVIKRDIDILLSQLHIWKKNPREITEKDYKRLKSQIVEFQQYKPLLVERIAKEKGFTVIGGNMRLRVLKEIGEKKVWCIQVKCKDKAERIKVSLSDNDRAGYYIDQALAELVYPLRTEIDLSQFKVDCRVPDIDLKNIISRFAPDNKGGENKPCSPSGFSGDAVSPKLQKMKLADFVNMHKTIICTFSGGKDSQATVLWVLKHCNKKKVRLLYVDTGIDWPDIPLFLDYCEKKFKCKIERIGLRDDEEWKKNLATTGYPCFTSLWCHHKLKAIFWEAWYKEKGFCNDKTVICIGVRKQESTKRSEYLDRGTLPNKQHFALPILNLLDTDECKLIKKEGLSLYPGYRYFDRTGCFCCPNMPKYKWRILRERYPKLWVKSMLYFAIAFKDIQYRAYFTRDVMKAIAFDQPLPDPPYAKYVDTKDIMKVTGCKDIWSRH